MFFVQKHLGGKGKSPPKLQNCKVVKVNSDTSSNSMDAPIATGRHRRFWGNFFSDTSYFFFGIVFVVLVFQSKKRFFNHSSSISPPKKTLCHLRFPCLLLEFPGTSHRTSSSDGSLRKSYIGSKQCQFVGRRWSYHDDEFKSTSQSHSKPSWIHDDGEGGGLKFGEVGDIFFLWMIFFVILEDVYR